MLRVYSTDLTIRTAKQSPTQANSIQEVHFPHTLHLIIGSQLQPPSDINSNSVHGLNLREVWHIQKPIHLGQVRPQSESSQHLGVLKLWKSTCACVSASLSIRLCLHCNDNVGGKLCYYRRGCILRSAWNAMEWNDDAASWFCFHCTHNHFYFLDSDACYSVAPFLSWKFCLSIQKKNPQTRMVLHVAIYILLKTAKY